MSLIISLIIRNNPEHVLNRSFEPQITQIQKTEIWETEKWTKQEAMPFESAEGCSSLREAAIMIVQRTSESVVSYVKNSTDLEIRSTMCCFTHAERRTPFDITQGRPWREVGGRIGEQVLFLPLSILPPRSRRIAFLHDLRLSDHLAQTSGQMDLLDQRLIPCLLIS